MAPIVEMRGIVKRYGGVQALAGADFAIYPGEILFEGRSVSIRDPRHAKALGIETVYQDLALADNLDIPANIFLGRELMLRGMLAPFMDLRRMAQESATLLARLKIRIPDLRQKVRTLSGGQRQCVGIARSVYFNARVIVLDEPTAALGVEETRKVLELVREMRAQGLSVVMISHNLAHVFDLADRITVMKTGVVAGSRRRAETSRDEILRLIVTGAPG